MDPTQAQQEPASGLPYGLAPEPSQSNLPRDPSVELRAAPPPRAAAAATPGAPGASAPKLFGLPPPPLLSPY